MNALSRKAKSRDASARKLIRSKLLLPSRLRGTARFSACWSIKASSPCGKLLTFCGPTWWFANSFSNSVRDDRSIACASLAFPSFAFFLMKSNHWILGLVLTLFLAGCKKPAASVAPPVASVTVAQPIPRQLSEWDEYTGRLAAVASVEVRARVSGYRSEEHTSELQSQSNLVCRLLLEKKKIRLRTRTHPRRCRR